ncbi:unnamed protein product [Cylicocyclus nassatus]|uniref:MULE transposase domain-containing protein n=1 Tax=Cylicocyclus nassatus TaxID=53992 RepID=A0AA36HFM0_CYLNA|nr:unnamed protein product [Cylicocyclus nassatus]
MSSALVFYTISRTRGVVPNSAIPQGSNCGDVVKFRLNGRRYKAKIPLLFGIMRNKSEQDYIVVFEKLKEFLCAASLESSGPELGIVVNFELATINAARTTFLNCTVEDCLWHLSQA